MNKVVIFKEKKSKFFLDSSLFSRLSDGVSLHSHSISSPWWLLWCHVCLWASDLNRLSLSVMRCTSAGAVAPATKTLIGRNIFTKLRVLHCPGFIISHFPGFKKRKKNIFLSYDVAGSPPIWRGGRFSFCCDFTLREEEECYMSLPPCGPDVVMSSLPR